MNIEYEIIGNTIPFDKSAEMYNRSMYIGPADDGWSFPAVPDHSPAS